MAQVGNAVEGETMSWIKCSERMPPAGVEVLVHGPHHYLRPNKCRMVASWRGDVAWPGWDVSDAIGGQEWELAITPTHWQFLPEPPHE